ncbi:metal ABC transporter ATPase [Paucisalibacillus globulus]|uniref:metal ABC transporter ATPase n=1 Tax=Paucisalibacillus globulus TaxID=351095 RepID=UPI00040DFFB5|nr:metal ABC transporter ATPase [Paucisalibacillus globulus]
MSEQTIFIKEETSEPEIIKVEEILNQLSGIERVLIDTDDGEVKIEFDEKTISKERIITILIENNFTIMQ